MPLRNIRQNNDPVLRQKAVSVSKFTPQLRLLLEDMAETMLEAEGVGLAAPQVGIAKRIIVVKVDEGILEVVNPEITSAKGTEVDVEGCLSLPGVFGEVPRYDRVTVSGRDRNGKKIELTAEGFLSRVLQHEIDHLDGVLFVDRASRLLSPEELQKM